MRSENSKFFLTDKLDFINMDPENFERSIRGEKPKKKLEPRLPRETVLAIYKSKESYTKIAETYKVGIRSISNIKRKVNYKRFLSDC